MPNYRRDQSPGGTWFFTVVAFNRSPILCQEKFRASLRQSILRTQKTYPFEIDAWILLPDHLHCVWTLPANDADFSIRWKLIKQFVSHDYRDHFQRQTRLSRIKMNRREGSIWQRRFWEHRLQNEKDFANHLDYIHYNPVKHGLAKAPKDWNYSSFGRYVTEGFYDREWGAGCDITFDEAIGNE